MSTTEEAALNGPDGVDARPDTPEESGVEDTANGAAALPRLTLEQIAHAKDLSTREMTVPEWGGTILLQELSLQEIEDVRTRAREHAAGGEIDDTFFSIHLVAATMADPDISVEQAGLLGQKSNSVLQRVLMEVLDINGLGEELKQIAERFQD